MSFDRRIDQICPHEVIEEALFFDADRRTVRPLRPISSIDSVRIRLDKEIEVPSEGVALPAQITGTREGPFSIQQGVNDTLSLRVNQGSVQTVILPAASRVPSDRIANSLNQGFGGGLLFSVVGGRIALRTTLTGRGSSFFVQSSSTLAGTLGIGTNREFRGQQRVSGWTLVGDPATLNDRPTRLIIFDEPLSSGSDFVEIDYVTLRQECRRCGGLGVENDWRYGSDGEIIEVRDEALLLQEIQKDIYTILGSNPFHTWYGSRLLDAIGKKLAAGGFIQNMIVSDVYQAFARWQNLKRQQEEKLGQFVSDGEFPFRLLSVGLQQSTQDPTVIFVNVTIQSRSNDQIQLERGLRLPQPLDSLTQGTIRQSLSNFAFTG